MLSADLAVIFPKYVGTINKYDTAPLIVLISIQAHLLLSITRKIYVR